jgi:primosomal protein N''
MCYDEPVKGLRVDVIAKLRNCPSFEELWERKMTFKLPGNKIIEIIGLEDLVQSKKTQRDKDWFMLDRLIANDILITKSPTAQKVRWWLSQCRDAGQLIGLATRYKKLAVEVAVERPLVKAALRKDNRMLQQLIQKEETIEREKDKKYWQPLRKELELLRHKKSPAH